MSAGRVALVGAGPGDPSLLTLRAAELLRSAEVVAHDELVSEAILSLVPETAELIAVGRRAGKGDLAYRLHPEVLERAKRGLSVVRLKAGDPLVFGRGGEEAEELAQHGIPFEIVPGISAALGAASYSAIPLTHRDRSAQVIITTGHRMDGGAPPPDSRGGRTLALYMASHELETNLARLVAAGWSRSTPAALVIAATTADERTITGTLGTLGARAFASVATTAESRLPALVLVGDVVALREGIDWRSHLPLRGRRIVVARARVGASVVAHSLRTFGGEVIELPHVVARNHHVAPARWPSRVDLVVLPGPSAARALYARAPAHLHEATTVAMGPRTYREALRCGALRLTRAELCTVEGLVLAAVHAVSAPEASARTTQNGPTSQEVTP